MATAPENFFTLDTKKLNELINKDKSEEPFLCTLPTITEPTENQFLQFNGDSAQWVTVSYNDDAEKLNALKERVKKLEELTNTQCETGNWDWDPYMHGMANGMILALSILEDVDAEFLDAPEKWGRTRMTANIDVMEQDFEASGTTPAESKYDGAMRALGLK